MDRYTRRDIMTAIDRATRVMQLVGLESAEVTLKALDVRALCDDVFVIAGLALGLASRLEPDDSENRSD